MVSASPPHWQKMGSGSFVPPRRFNSSNCGFTLEIPPGVAGSPAGGGTQRGSPPPAGRGLQPHPPPKTGIAHVGGSGASLLRRGGCRLPSALRAPPPGLFFLLRSLVFSGKSSLRGEKGPTGKRDEPRPPSPAPNPHRHVSVRGSNCCSERSRCPDGSWCRERASPERAGRGEASGEPPAPLPPGWGR